MRKVLIAIFIFSILMSLLINMGCKKSEDAAVYSFYVTVYKGVTGTPEAGAYAYAAGEKVDYRYTLETGYSGLKVTLDGTEIAGSGTITVSKAHTLEAFPSQGTGNIKISVTCGTGVNGTPATGFYYYNTGDLVSYNYTLASGYSDLVVLLDGNIVDNPGTFTVSTNHILKASASKIYEIRASWTLNEQYEDGSSFSVTATFSGDLLGGVVIDSDGGVGTYTVAGADVTFNLDYPDVTYRYTGSFSSEDAMSGTSKRYISATMYKAGSWTADRIEDSRGRSRSYSHSKSKGNR